MEMVSGDGEQCKFDSLHVAYARVRACIICDDTLGLVSFAFQLGIFGYLKICRYVFKNGFPFQNENLVLVVTGILL